MLSGNKVNAERTRRTRMTNKMTRLKLLLKLVAIFALLEQLASHFVECARPTSGRQQASNSSPDAPKLIPLSALDRYHEGADLRLFCSASAPPTAGRLHFEWRKNQNELLTSTSTNSNGDSLPVMMMTTTTTMTQQNMQQNKQRLQVSSMDDESASLLRITQLEADDSGNYTCLVRNQHGHDSSTVRVQVNVKLKWTLEPPGELQVKAGNFVQLECDASGQPTPAISWTSLRDRQTINSKVLRIDRVTTNHSGLYECRAMSHDFQAAGQAGAAHENEQLRKLVRLVVNGVNLESVILCVNPLHMRLTCHGGCRSARGGAGGPNGKHRTQERLQK